MVILNGGDLRENIDFDRKNGFAMSTTLQSWGNDLRQNVNVENGKVGLQGVQKFRVVATMRKLMV